MGGLTRPGPYIITLAAFIARNQTIELADHLNLALDSGVTPGELSESKLAWNSLTSRIRTSLRLVPSGSRTDFS